MKKPEDLFVARWQMHFSLGDFFQPCFLIAVWVSFYDSPWVYSHNTSPVFFFLSPAILRWPRCPVLRIVTCDHQPRPETPWKFHTGTQPDGLELAGGLSFQMAHGSSWGGENFRLKVLGNFSQAELSIRDIFPRVNCVQLTVNW